MAAQAFSLVEASEGYSPVVLRGLLIAVAFLVPDHRLEAHGLSSCSARA